MIADERSVEGALELKISGKILIREEACSYKAVKAASYITEVLEKINLAQLLNSLAEAQQLGVQAARSIVEAGDLKEEIDTLTEKLETNGVLERDVEFVREDIRRKQELRVEMRAEAMRDQQSDGQYYTLLARALPLVFEEAPEFIYNFCALMMIPNDELEKAYRAGQNKVKKAVQKNRDWLMFHTMHFEPLEIATFYLPSLGLDVLKKEGGTLVDTVMKVMMPETEPDATQNGASSLDSSKSSRPSSESEETN